MHSRRQRPHQSPRRDRTSRPISHLTLSRAQSARTPPTASASASIPDQTCLKWKQAHHRTPRWARAFSTLTRLQHTYAPSAHLKIPHTALCTDVSSNPRERALYTIVRWLLDWFVTNGPRCTLSLTRTPTPSPLHTSTLTPTPILTLSLIECLVTVASHVS